MFVSTFGTGMSLGVPDVCMTPPFAIPAPFPNLAQNAMAIPSYFTVAINAMPELNMTAMYAMSNGDEGGTMGDDDVEVDDLHGPRIGSGRVGTRLAVCPIL